MKDSQRRRALTALCVLFVGLVAGCGLQSASGAVLEARPGAIGHYDSLKGVKLTVAAKDFTEQLILGNMFSTVLAAAGADVTNLTNIPGSFGARQRDDERPGECLAGVHGHRLDQLSRQREPRER